VNDIATQRDLPQVETFAASFVGAAPASVIRSEARAVIDRARQLLADGDATTLDALRLELAGRLAARQPMTGVINATGVLLHTNLGRAPLEPLPRSANGLGAVPIELALDGGRRHRRLESLEAGLCDLTGAGGALVVNNNAAALLLVLSSLAAGGDVVVSRGQLIEIGGSFRIPEIVSQGGAVLHEVGTTNRTHLRDFASAITESTRVLLEIHLSNFEQSGFVATVDTTELAALGREHRLPVVFDIGSGLVDSSAPWLPDGVPSWLRGEPGARQALAAGANIVTFSGDKLLGGPQAGIICGDRDLVDRIREHPLARAVRYDKVRAAHLHATVRAYLDRTAGTEVPFWRMASTDLPTLEARASAMIEKLSSERVAAEVVSVVDAAGAGSAAGKQIEGRAISIKSEAGPEPFAAWLRKGTPPVLSVARDGGVLLSLRTVRPEDDDALVAAVTNAHSASVARLHGNS